jgi:hypothetical protein
MFKVKKEWYLYSIEKNKKVVSNWLEISILYM